MPVQRTLFGRLVAVRLPPRRFQVTFSFLLFLLITALVYEGPDPLQEQLANVKAQVGDALGGIPASVHNPFRHVHKPPTQDDSSSGDSSWFDNLQWRNPFSASVTYDDRIVLPPLRSRPAIYTYYETANPKDKTARKAEDKLLLAWRRAWWAHGFRPLVLGRAEASNSVLYKDLSLLKDAKLEPAFEYELRRWLAWSSMGTGILANWLMFPMGSPTDPLITFLRQGDSPDVKTIRSFGGGLVYGEKSKIEEMINNVLRKNDTSILTGIKSLLDVPGASYQRMEEQHSSMALYDMTTLQAEYSVIAERLNATEGQAEGLGLLLELINSHLHLTWQSLFADGIAVLRPLKHMTILTNPAMNIAMSLAQCSYSPIPKSCPPKQQCQPCAGSLPVQTLPAFRNDSSLYVIGSVPHPYTVATLDTLRGAIDLRYIRRNLSRDPWLEAATIENVPYGYGSSRRLVSFKDAVASEYGETHSLWLTAEGTTHKDLNWKFGFDLPELPLGPDEMLTADTSVISDSSNGNGSSDSAGSSNDTAVLSDTEADPSPNAVGPHPQQDLAARERELLEAARKLLRGRLGGVLGSRGKVLRAATEAWSQADAEAWRFTRAFARRRRKEREGWERREKGFAGAERKAWWGR